MEELRMIATTGETGSCIGHVTPAGGNIFLDLGFPPDEAARLLAESNREIAVHDAVKKHLVDELAKWIEETQLSPVDAANKLGVPPKRIRDVLARNENKFSIEHLVRYLITSGRKVTVEIN
jgi:predicted XRE-type DNA-binding protein